MPAGRDVADIMKWEQTDESRWSFRADFGRVRTALEYVSQRLAQPCASNMLRMRDELFVPIALIAKLSGRFSALGSALEHVLHQ
jgi:hypothetical protein